MRIACAIWLLAHQCGASPLPTYLPPSPPIAPNVGENADWSPWQQQHTEQEEKKTIELIRTIILPVNQLLTCACYATPTSPWIKPHTHKKKDIHAALHCAKVKFELNNPILVFARRVHLPAPVLPSSWPWCRWRENWCDPTHLPIFPASEWAAARSPRPRS